MKRHKSVSPVSFKHVQRDNFSFESCKANEFVRHCFAQEVSVCNVFRPDSRRDFRITLFQWWSTTCLQQLSTAANAFLGLHRARFDELRFVERWATTEKCEALKSTENEQLTSTSVDVVAGSFSHNLPTIFDSSEIVQISSKCCETHSTFCFSQITDDSSNVDNVSKLSCQSDEHFGALIVAECADLCGGGKSGAAEHHLDTVRK